MKVILRGLMTGLLAGACCWTMAAQDKPAAAGAKTAKDAGEMAMPMPKPDPQMTRLIKMMTGSWTVAEKSNPSPMMPKGGAGKGTATFAPGPGNLSLVEKYHSSGMMGASFNGLGVFWWEAKAQAYKGLWCDTMTPGGCDGSGMTKWEGDNLVGVMDSEMNGQKMVTKFVYSDWKPNSFVMKMESGPNASSLQEVMTITYTRAHPVAATAATAKPAQ
jgi:hypothetical protein